MTNKQKDELVQRIRMHCCTLESMIGETQRNLTNATKWLAQVRALLSFLWDNRNVDFSDGQED